MKKNIFLLLIALLGLSACSGGDETASNQVSEPKTELSIDKPVEEKVVVQQKEQSSRDVASVLLNDTQSKIELEQTIENSAGVQSSANDQATQQTEEQAVEAEVVEKSPENQEFLVDWRQVEAELAEIDDAQILKQYPNGSGLSFERKPLVIIRTTQTLTSNVTSVSGATSIFSDPSGFGFTVGLSGDYLFEFDKDALTPEAQESLESVFALYNEYEGEAITVTGHTDAKGSKEYNQGLSVRRASSVKNWFVQAGIDQAIIKTLGLGETQPIAPNTKNGQDFPEGRAQNRRVDIQVKTKKKVNHLPTISNKAKF